MTQIKSSNDIGRFIDIALLNSVIMTSDKCYTFVNEGAFLALFDINE